MSAITYLFPLLIIVGIGFYYLNIYKKGKAAGGGMMEGFRVQQDEKWNGVMEPGETISVHGMGIVWRPAWQVFLARQVPALRLVWPTVMHAMVVTNKDRVLIGRYGALGGIKDQVSYPRSAIRVERADEEKPGLFLKLNPLYQAFGADYKTFEAVFALPTESLRLMGVPGAFVEAVKGSVRSAA